MAENNRPLGSLPPIVPADEAGSHNALVEPSVDTLESHSNAAVEESEVTATPTADGHRGPSELGVLEAIPDKVSVPEPDRTVGDEASELPEDVKSSLPSSIFGPTAALGILALLSAILIFLYYHVLGIIGDLAALPAVFRDIGYAALAVLVTVIVAFGLRLVYLWSRLRRTPAVRLGGLRKLSEHRSLRKMAVREKSAAQKTLLDYLKQYPEEGSTHEKLLARLGMDEDEIHRLRKTRHRLLDPTIGRSPGDWLEEFHRNFGGILDKLAIQSVKRRAFLVGVKTAAAPNPVVDMLVATYGAFVITGDVCRIYNLRAGAVGTLVIMAHAFANIFFAGQLEDAMDTAADAIFDETTSLTALIFGKVSSRVAEGAANGILLYRLGRSVITLVQPIRQ